MSEPVDEALIELLLECEDNCVKLDAVLLELEVAPTDSARIGAAFRALHSIKGAAGFLDLHALQETAHASETVLSQARDGTLLVDTDVLSLLLAAADQVRGALARVRAGESEGEVDRGLLDALHAAAARPPRPVGTPPAPASASPVAPASPAAASATEPVEPAAAPGAAGDPTRSGDADETVRVDVNLLDDLMNLVGELVVTRNQLVQLLADDERDDYRNAARRLDLLTSEIQVRVMKTRLRPVGSAWGRLPRIVRDVARSCGKDVRLAMEGEGTELDRSILGRLKDPLNHIVRNAIDHGVEPAADRLAAGKPGTATVSLRAWTDAGYVHMAVADDGRGLDPQKIAAKAVERGLISADAAARMPEEHILRLIFLPGFSTAASVTSLSGRGVGMDVVRTNVEEVGGSIDLTSTVGRGTTVAMRIPLTLAIIPALIVRTAGRNYAIAQSQLVELVDLLDRRAAAGIERVLGSCFFRLREELIPLVTLSTLLGNPGSVEGQGGFIVVVRADTLTYGLIVDDVFETEEIVVKPLGAELRGAFAFSGATIRGDGNIALVVDVSAIARHVGAVTPETGRVEAVTPRAPAEVVLRVVTRLDGVLAIPVGDVERIEEMPADRVNREGGRAVLVRDGHVVPLVDREQTVPTSGQVTVVICRRALATVGLVVRDVLEVVEVDDPVNPALAGPITAGMAVVAGQASGVVDVGRMLEASLRGAA